MYEVKITKEKLKQIIKEELEFMEQETPEEDPELTKTRSEFAKKLLAISKKIPSVSGLDTAEMQLIMNFIVGFIEFSAAKNAGPMLAQIEKIVSKKTGVK